MKWTEDDEKQPGQIELDTVYPFEIVEAEERVSEKGNPYINLKLRVFVDDNERTMYDNIMPQMPEKLRSFCETVGLMEQYNSKTLTVVDCGSGSGFLRTTKKPGYQDRPQVDFYLVAKSPTAKNASYSEKLKEASAAVQGEEDIPF